MAVMRDVVDFLSRATADRPVVVATGVGSHQSIVARHFDWDYPRRILLTSAGHGTMGSGLPMAIGAALERPGDLILCLNGDGSMQLDMAQLATLAERRLNIKVIVLDNGSMGIVRQFEDLQGLKNVATRNEFNPDFAGIARACGLRAAGPIRQGAEALIRLALDTPGPWLVHVLVEDYAVWPILEGGRLEMTPPNVLALSTPEKQP